MKRELGSLVAAFGGLDVLVFTAGIGEHAAPIRARVCLDAQWLGLRLDAEANRVGGPRISADDSAVSVWVIPTDEDAMIARQTHDVLRRTAAANNEQKGLNLSIEVCIRENAARGSLLLATFSRMHRSATHRRPFYWMSGS